MASNSVTPEKRPPVFGGQKTDIREADDDDYNLTSCGIGWWRPNWLQCFARPLFFLMNLSLIGIVQSMNGPIFLSAMSTLEKRYSFDSTISGIILIADNISQLMVSPLAGYIAVRFNRARLIAIAEMFLAFSCFLSAGPYFIYGAIDHTETTDSFANQTMMKPRFQLCRSNDPTTIGGPGDQCTADGSRSQTVWPAVILLFFGSFFRGIGFTCYFVIGFPFLDDNVSKKNSPLYMSFIQAIRLIGPTAGYLLSSLCLKYYENPLVDPGFSRKDPRFVGAWWLAFCIVGGLLLVATLPMFLFPPQFKSASVKADTIKKKLKQSGGGLQAMKRFLTNPVVMIYMFGSIFRYIGIGGYIMLKTKYIESHFRLTSSSASMVTGTATILPMAIGIMLGGAFLTIFKPTTRFILIYIFLVESFSIITMGSGIFMKCPPLNISGTVSPDTGLLDLNSVCNANCSCTNHRYSPVCQSDQQITYFSPCYAGCQSYENFNKTFSDCSCTGTGTGTVVDGYCQKDQCTNKLYYYIFTILTGAIVSSTARTANALISFRSVDPLDKGFTMGALSSFMAIFADSVCLLWESKCKKRGNCWLYDQDKFRIYFHGAVVLFMCIGSVFDFVMIFFSNRIKNFYDDDDDDDNQEKVQNKIELQTASSQTKKSPPTISQQLNGTQ